MVAHFVVESWNRSINGAEAIAVRFRATPTFSAAVSHSQALTTTVYVIFALMYRRTAWGMRLVFVQSQKPGIGEKRGFATFLYFIYTLSLFA